MTHKSFLDAMKSRRSLYDLGTDKTVNKEEILHIVRQAVKHVPSAFNSQSSRALVLFGEAHHRLWDIVLKRLKEATDQKGFAAASTKVEQSFRSGCGTVLFFEDNEVVEQLQKQYPAYKDAFPDYALQTAGMAQFAVWTLLEEAGYGASLQHYQNLIEGDVLKEWQLPASWRLISQMPFGSSAFNAPEKEFQPIEKRVLSADK